MGIFDFLNMIGNYEVRKIDRYEDNNGFVSTCSVSDSQDSYETGISKNNESVVIVETYKTREEAVIGHKKWTNRYIEKTLPKTLIDVGTSEIVDLYNSFKNLEDEN